jgi:MYXO-CTERM domain-containing protein
MTICGGGRMHRWLLALAAAGALGPARGAQASVTFVVNNLDGAGQGFNDPTPAAPVGGNSGTTLGQQRLNAFMQATSIWGQLIDSYVPVVIDANFGALSCTASSITLGQARATGFEFNAPGLPPNTLFPEPLADRIAGVDLAPGMADIQATFNGDLAGCSNGEQDWYYGFDGKTSGAQIDLISVILHELGHGLGFLSGVDDGTGELAGGFIDSFSAHLFDNGTGQLWSAMTDAQRAASAQNVRHLVWQGDNVSAMAPMVLATGAPRIAVSPALSQLEGALSEADFGPYLSAKSVRAPIVLGNPLDGCAQPPDYTGVIALLQGGDCPSVQKTSLAESGGALAVLIADPDGVAPPSSVEVPLDQNAMFPVSIPTIGVTDGDYSLLGVGGETATLDADQTRLVGTDAQGRMYLYASDPLVPGSTVSHWDPLARPNLMQEPNASYEVSHDLRMEAALMRDIGWTPFCGNGHLDQAEQCDNGAANSDTAPGACRTDCLLAHCGDGVVDSGEACDDGAGNSDTAPGACRTTCVKPSCGDGVVDPGEACDSGAQNSDTAPGACRTSCVKAACGDGVVDPGEQCDHGAANGTDNQCATDCTVPSISAPAGGHGCSCAVGDGPGWRGSALLFVGLALLVGRRRRR